MSAQEDDGDDVQLPTTYVDSIILDYLRAMRDSGLYGNTISEVVEGLVQEGIRKAITQRIIGKRERGDPMRSLDPRD